VQFELLSAVCAPASSSAPSPHQALPPPAPPCPSLLCPLPPPPPRRRSNSIFKALHCSLLPQASSVSSPFHGQSPARPQAFRQPHRPRILPQVRLPNIQFVRLCRPSARLLKDIQRENYPRAAAGPSGKASAHWHIVRAAARAARLHHSWVLTLAPRYKADYDGKQGDPYVRAKGRSKSQLDFASRFATRFQTL
jgi:hypothetical protein